MSHLRIAVIGAGHLGRIHTRLASNLPNVELVGVVDPAAEARQTLAREYHTNAYRDYQELVGHIDAAVVAAPTQLHHELAIGLLKNGIHVLVEKPISETSDQAREMIHHAEARGLILQVGHVERFNPVIDAVQPYIQQPKYIEAARTSGYTFRSTDIGVVLDLMIHDIDLVLSWVQAPVTEVRALGMSILGGHEDMAQARLQFANGCVANLSASRCSFKAQRNCQVFALQGYAKIDFASNSAQVIAPDAALLDRELQLDTITTDQKADLRENLFSNFLPLSEVKVEPQNAIEQEQLDFVASIRQKTTPRVSGHDGCDALAIAERILAEIHAHAWTDQPGGLRGPLATPGSQTLPQPLAEPAAPFHRKAG